jgi:CHASE2 domain-containing sensor protein
LDGLLFVIGFIFLSLASLKTFKEGIVNPSMLLLISTSVLFYGTIGFLWADYNRYYIPIYPMVALVMGFGVWKIVEFVKGKIKPKTIAA